MTWTFTHNVDVFLAAAGPSLAARPVEHTVALTVTERLRRSGAHHYGDDDPVLGWWRGAAVTAESSRAALAEGAAEVLLFTDLANPTSNGVYLRTGYEPVADRVQLRRET